MRKKIVMFICFILLTIFVSCKQEEQKPDMEAVSSEVDYVEEETVKVPSKYVLNEFDRSLIDYLWSNGYYDSDFIVSPASFRASLCLAAAGAEGNTRTELVNAAGFSSMAELDSWYQEFQNVIGGNSCLAGVSVWNDEELLGAFTDSYNSQIKQQYHADSCVCETDMMTANINEWVSVKTGGEISSIEKDVTGASSVLVSALYIPLSWTDNINVKDGQTGEFLYAEEGGTQILAVPMRENLSFVCFTGNRTDMFDKLEKTKKENIRVTLPDFEASSVFDSNDLLNFLLTRGVGDSLNWQTANFYNMCQDSDWFLQETIQTVKLSADTETGVKDGQGESVADSADDKQDTKEFAADGSFSFIVFYGFGTSDQQALMYGQVTAGGLQR